jgi:hypothetical protein
MVRIADMQPHEVMDSPFTKVLPPYGL